MTHSPMSIADPPTADGPLQVAVVGAGRWGRLHAAKLAAMPDVRLMAVVDRDPSRARALAAEHDAIAFGRVDALPGAIAAATVAVDLPRLASVTARLLERDVHVLAEKPLALDGHAAGLLVELAMRRRRHLVVGYLERFLPIRIDGPGRRLVARRVGPARYGAGPLALDRLVHDIDHALRLVGPDLRPTEARFDHDHARLELAAGDRIARVTVAHRSVPGRRLWIDGERFDLRAGQGDPLADQLAAFCRLASGGDGGPLATGRDAAGILRVLDAAGVVRPAA